MAGNPKKLKRELRVKSSTDNLAAIRDFVKSSAEESGFSNDTVGKIILAVDEACTNVIKHAYKFSSDREITVGINLRDSKFTISIVDQGSKFNPDIIPEPNLTEYHKQRRVGGLGMFLMKKLMDEVSYQTLSNNKNQVVLVKYLA